MKKLLLASLLCISLSSFGATNVINLYSTPKLATAFDADDFDAITSVANGFTNVTISLKSSQSLIDLTENLNNWSLTTTQQLGIPHSYFISASPTPPMGWCTWSWDGDGVTTNFQAYINEASLIRIADIMATNGMLAYGWNIIQWDDGVFTTTNEFGILIPEVWHFPYGLKHTSDALHARGFKVGGYIEVGEGNTDLSYGTPCWRTGTNVVGNAIQFATYDLDYVKFHSGRGVTVGSRIGLERGALFATTLATYSSRPMHLYNIMPDNPTMGGYHQEYSKLYGSWYSANVNVAANPAVDAKMDDNIGYFPEVAERFDKAYLNQRFTAPGHYIMAFDAIIQTTNTQLQITMCAMLSAPMFLYNPTYVPGMPLYTNTYVLSVHQDPAVIRCYKSEQLDSLVNGVTNSVYVKPLGGEYTGRKAVMLFNRDTVSNDFTFALKDVGMQPVETTVFDCWRKTSIGTISSGSITVKVAPTNAALLILTSSLGNNVQLNGNGQAIIVKSTGSGDSSPFAQNAILGVTNSYDAVSSYLGNYFGYACLWLGTNVNYGYQQSSLFTANSQTFLNTKSTPGAGFGYITVDGTGYNGNVGYARWNTNGFNFHAPVISTNLNNDIRFPTNTGPTITWGVTVPDEWIRLTNSVGQVRFLPTWKAQ